ncbi:hypothetical protein BELL_0570g00030 [Botrytis elliptica]|uniref:Uncharacterized protein n=1 Tax=Botrytis elliptica TaxID=278938 RepID=A0A4Z1JRE7_9HELO|nr:hypothetical protein BELL_0570g00030 [Botrytis elliptica]
MKLVAGHTLINVHNGHGYPAALGTGFGTTGSTLGREYSMGHSSTENGAMEEVREERSASPNKLRRSMIWDSLWSIDLSLERGRGGGF